MSVPRLPPFFDMIYTNSDGTMTQDAHLYNDQMFQSLNVVVNYFNDGVQFPSKTTAEITSLEPNSSVGTIWFNTTLSKLQVKTASGTIETITSV
jgi:hypothetical protein